MLAYLPFHININNERVSLLTVSLGGASANIEMTEINKSTILSSLFIFSGGKLDKHSTKKKLNPFQ
jgi:hypothetical protein